MKTIVNVYLDLVSVLLVGAVLDVNWPGVIINVEMVSVPSWEVKHFAPVSQDGVENTVQFLVLLRNLDQIVKTAVIAATSPVIQ